MFLQLFRRRLPRRPSLPLVMLCLSVLSSVSFAQTLTPISGNAPLNQGLIPGAAIPAGAIPGAVVGLPAGLVDGFFTQSNAPNGETIFSAFSNPVMGDWRVVDGNVALHVGTITIPIRGANAVDLNGTRAGSISQLLQTVPGTQYTVRFSATGNWRTNPNQPRSLTVAFGNSLVPFTIQPGAAPNALGWQTLSATFTATGLTTDLQFRSNDVGLPDGAFITGVELLDVAAAPIFPPALNTVPVPMPANLADFVVNQEKAILLGKALFWDMQVGSDGLTACATCHWNAGADIRTANDLHPGAPGSAFGPNGGRRQALLGRQAAAGFRGANTTLTAADFPFHLPTNPALPGDEPGFAVGNPIVRTTLEVAGSQGVVGSAGAGFTPGVAAEAATVIPSTVHRFGGVNARATTGRNSPTNINAVFFDRLFWDGRARNEFNGVNPLGDMDPNARVLQVDATGRLLPVRVRLANSALASQAVGPVLSDVEMSWTGREFAQVAQKLFSLTPLAQQQVAADDSVLGPFVAPDGGKGLDPATVSYAALIREAFAPQWWSSQEVTAAGFTQMESNFSLFWGLSLMMYQSTLVSDRAPYDQWANGDLTALSDQAQVGLNIFMNEGRCIICHHGAEFAGPTINNLAPAAPGGPPELLVELMRMGNGGPAFYDFGFYNLGVRPTSEDLGVGANHPAFGPLSYTRQIQQGRIRLPGVAVPFNARTAVLGAFKTPSLRNVELTGPYMHNGGQATLEEVVAFYARGADFFNTNLAHLDPEIFGIPTLQGNNEQAAALVAFMKALTDERVRYQAAPFDHPELILPNGQLIPQNGLTVDNAVVFPATGQAGGAPLQTFAEALGGLSLAPFTGQLTPVAAPAVNIQDLAPAPPAVPTPPPNVQPGPRLDPIAAPAPAAPAPAAPAPAGPVVLDRAGNPLTASFVSGGANAP